MEHIAGRGFVSLSDHKARQAAKKKRIYKKKGSRGKSKGNTFERKIAGFMDTWWGVPSKTFWRNTNSGAWKPEPGDIGPRHRDDVPAFVFPFIIEAKHYKRVDFVHLLLPDQKWNKFELWWKQVTAAQSASKKNLIRLLIFHGNGQPVCVMFSPGEIGNGSYLGGKGRCIFYHRINTWGMSGYAPDSDLCIMTWDAFVQAYPKEIFTEILEHPEKYTIPLGTPLPVYGGPPPAGPERAVLPT